MPDNFDEYQLWKESKRVIIFDKSDTTKKLAKWFCRKCLRLFTEKPDYIYNHDSVVTYRMLVCPKCKCDKIYKIGRDMRA